MEGWTDARSYGRKVTKTGFSRIDIFLTMMLRARAFGMRGAPLQQQDLNITLLASKYLKGRRRKGEESSLGKRTICKEENYALNLTSVRNLIVHLVS